MNLEELFQEYKDISLDIIKILEEDLVEQLDGKFEERRKILEKITRKNENQKILKGLYEEYELFKIDEEMKQKLEKSMKDVKIEIAKIKKRKEANKLYNNINARSIYLSKKI